MVLAELGQQITAALKKLSTSSVVDNETLQECLKEITHALLQADVNVKLVAQIRNNIRSAVISQEEKSSCNRVRLIQKRVVDELVKLLKAEKAPFKPVKGKCNVVMFVGLQGSGKTTTCTKYAHFYRRKGWKVGLVCADTFRAGAFDQLKQNATRVGIPFYGSYTEADPVRIGTEGVDRFKEEKFDLIIVDTSGRHKQETALFTEMEQMAANISPSDIVFVMDGHMGQACAAQAEAFRASVDVGSVIVTKLDGHAKGGGALSAVATTGAPIIFIGTGEHFDDLEPFSPESFVSRLLGLGDIKGLLNTVAEAMPLEKQPEMIARLAHGSFTLRDLRDQLQGILNMGPLGQFMSMLPGFGGNAIPKATEREGTAQIRRFLFIMDSMTRAELDCEKSLDQSRILRIAKGSGHHVEEVKMLIERFKQFSKLFSKLGKGFGKKAAKGGNWDMSQMMRNPGQLMQNMQRAMDPRILKQMGGAQNLMGMMKQMSQSHGNPHDFL